MKGKSTFYHSIFVTSLKEYLKFRLLDIEEQLITGKQQLHKMIETVSSTNCKSDPPKKSDRNTNVVEYEVEFGTGIPEGDSPVAEVKGHLVWIKQILGAVTTETGQLEDAIKVGKSLIVWLFT